MNNDDPFSSSRAILVLGMHRSGTSALTRCVNLMGPSTGPESELIAGGADENPRGFWENTKLTELNDELLSMLGGTWYMPPSFFDNWWQDPSLKSKAKQADQLLQKTFRTPTWVWKDPRNCILYPFWQARLPSEPVVLLIHRNPLEVWRSLANRNSLTKRISLSLWETYTRAALNNAKGLPVFSLRFENLLTEPMVWIEKIHEFLSEHGFSDLSIPELGQVNEFISRDLRHFIHDDQVFFEDKEISDRQKELYRALTTLPDQTRSFIPPDLPTPLSESGHFLENYRDWLALGDQLEGDGNLITLRSTHREASPYHLNEGGWLKYYHHLADQIIDQLRPRKVAEVGLFGGLLAQALQEREVEARGYFNSASTNNAFNEFENSSVPSTEISEQETSRQPFDLAVCTQPPLSPTQEEAEALVGKLCRQATEVLFSPEPVFSRNYPVTSPKETSEFWDDIFLNHGFSPAETPSVSFLGPGARLYRREGAIRVTFVLNTTTLHGGVLVVLKHANLLAEKGFVVTIASWDPKPPDWMDLHPAVRFVYAPADDPIAFMNALPCADSLIATFWATAPMINLAPIEKGQKLYLIQAYETLWAGEPDEVDATYKDLPLQKLVVSSWLKEILESSLNEGSSLVLNGCDFAGHLTEPSPTRDGDDLRIGMLYHESQVKGTPDGLAAFHHLRKRYPKTKLILFGAQRPKVLPSDCDEFITRPSRDELQNLLRSLDIFISSSIAEGFGLPALEALSCGVPVVMTDSGGCRDYASEKTVLLSPPNHPDILGENLVKAVEDAQLRASLSKHGLKKANEFTWERSNEMLERALNSSATQDEKKLHILYISAGFIWADAYLDPMYINALRDLGHQVTVFDPRPENWQWAKEYLNVHLLDQSYIQRYFAGEGGLPSEIPSIARQLAPDLVFFNHGLVIPNEVLNTLRKAKIPTGVWMPDEPQEMYMSAARGRLFDYVFLQDRGSLSFHLKKGNPNTFYLPHGFDPATHYPNKTSEMVPKRYRSDVLLIGTGFPRRREIVKALANNGFQIRLIGRYWDELEAPNIKIESMVSFEEAAKYYRGAKITLNIHRDAMDFPSGAEIPEPASPNASFFFIAGCGSLQMVNDNYPGALEFFLPGEHYRSFKSTEDLVEQVHFYLDHPDHHHRIVQKAYTVARENHTYAHRFKASLAQIGRPRSSRRVFGLGKSIPKQAKPIQSIILIASENLKKLKTSITFLRLAMKDPHELLVIHPQDPEVGAWLDKEQITHHIDRSKNLSTVYNIGKNLTEGEYLIFLNEDVITTPNFSRRLVALLEENSKIAMIGPANNVPGSNQELAIPYRSVNDFFQFSRTLYLEENNDLQETLTLDTLCFALRREALDSIGSFDERYPSDTLEIMDWCHRAILAGWQICWTPRVFLHSQGNENSQVNKAKSVLKAEQLFEQKWGTWNISGDAEKRSTNGAKVLSSDPDKDTAHAVDTLQMLLLAEDLPEALLQHEDRLDDHVLNLIQINASTAYMDGDENLGEGLDNLATYVAEVLAERQALVTSINSLEISATHPQPTHHTLPIRAAPTTPAGFEHSAKKQSKSNKRRRRRKKR